MIHVPRASPPPKKNRGGRIFIAAMPGADKPSHATAAAAAAGVVTS